MFLETKFHPETLCPHTSKPWGSRYSKGLNTRTCNCQSFITQKENVLDREGYIHSAKTYVWCFGKRGGWNLITFPGTKGSIDVVEPSNTTLHFEILGIMFAKLLSCQLLQAISILWLPRITKRINMHINFVPTREHINISIGFCRINIATSEVDVVFKKKWRRRRRNLWNSETH